MSIAWVYLDKRSATAAAIKDFESMKSIIRDTDEAIKSADEHMSGIGAQNLDGLPHSHDPKAGEERMAGTIDEIDTLKERYRQAAEYMAWFRPAWEHLSDDERFILDAFYNSGYGDGAADAVGRYLGVERTAAYNRKNRALARLSVLLFGKV